jgi:hypothetical protein
VDGEKVEDGATHPRDYVGLANIDSIAQAMKRYSALNAIGESSLRSAALANAASRVQLAAASSISASSLRTVAEAIERGRPNFALATPVLTTLNDWSGRTALSKFGSGLEGLVAPSTLANLSGAFDAAKLYNSKFDGIGKALSNYSALSPALSSLVNNGQLETQLAAFSRNIAPAPQALLTSLQTRRNTASRIDKMIDSVNIGSFGLDYRSVIAQVIETDEYITSSPRETKQVVEQANVVLEEAHFSDDDVINFQNAFGLRDSRGRVRPGFAILAACTSGLLAYAVDASLNMTFSPVSSIVIGASVYRELRTPRHRDR